jgi:uncharacterized membrane protein
MLGLPLHDLVVGWGSYFANHAAVRTVVAFAHVGGLVAAGGAAMAIDRELLAVMRLDEEARQRLLVTLHSTHGLVVVGLLLVTTSGLLLFAADVDSFLYSRVFWIKMALLVLLTINGMVLVAAKHRAERGRADAWPTLRATAIASIALWFLVTLGGAALPNIG